MTAAVVIAAVWLSLVTNQMLKTDSLVVRSHHREGFQHLIKKAIRPVDLLLVHLEESQEYQEPSIMHQLLSNEATAGGQPSNHSPLLPLDGAVDDEDDETDDLFNSLDEEETDDDSLMGDGGFAAPRNSVPYDPAMQQMVELNQHLVPIPIERHPMMTASGAKYYHPMMNDVNAIMQQGNYYPDSYPSPSYKPGSGMMMMMTFGEQDGDDQEEEEESDSDDYDSVPPFPQGGMNNGSGGANTTQPNNMTQGADSTIAPTTNSSSINGTSFNNTLLSLTTGTSLVSSSNSGSQSTLSISLCFLAIPLIIAIIISLGADEVLLVFAFSVVLPVFLFVAFSLSGATNSGRQLNKGSNAFSYFLNNSDDIRHRRQQLDDQVKQVLEQIQRYHHVAFENQ